MVSYVNINRNSGVSKSVCVFSAQTPQLQKTAFSTHQTSSVCRSRAIHLFDKGTLEKRCNRSTLIFPHVKKLLLTWHFLTRKGYSTGEGEVRAAEGETQRDTKEMQHHDGTEPPVNSPHFSPL